MPIICKRCNQLKPSEPQMQCFANSKSYKEHEWSGEVKCQYIHPDGACGQIEPHTHQPPSESKKGENWRMGYQQGYTEGRQKALEEVMEKLPINEYLDTGSGFKIGFFECKEQICQIIK